MGAASLLFAAPARAQDKSGSRDGLIKLPSAGGTVSAEGSTFLVQSNTGEANYAFPLPELPGRAGVVPKLTLTYNPMSGDTATGFGSGWRLDVPSIEVSFEGGIPWPSGLTDNYNVFRLRGERLFADPNGPPADPTQPVPYYLQTTEQAIQVRYHSAPYQVGWANPIPGDGSAAPSLPSISVGFEVVYPDGKVELYSGDLAQAEGTNLGGAVDLVTRYPLVYEIYRQGEWVKYTYSKVGENSYLAEVAFASGLSKYTFDLAPSASNVHTYQYGFRQSNGILVDRLTATYGGQIRNRWCFAYEGPSGASSGGLATAPECLAAALQRPPATTDDQPVHDRLASILRYGNTADVTASSLHEPRVDFEYSSLSTAALASRPLVYPVPALGLPLKSSSLSNLELIDVNDDGLPDVVQSLTNALPDVYYGNADPTRSFVTNTPLSLNRQGHQVAMDLTRSTFQVADINGDGFEDILEFESGTMQVYAGGNENPPAQPYVWRGALSLSDFDASWFDGGAAQFVDLNQDGLTDILTTTSGNEGQQWTVFLNNTWVDSAGNWTIQFGRADFTLPLAITEPKFLTDVKQYDVIDVNGDTLPDFTWTNGPQGWMCVYENTGEFYQNPVPTTLLFGRADLTDPDCGNGVKVALDIPAAARTYDTWMLDVNGDGILDVVTLGQTFAQLSVWYGQGDLRFSAPALVPLNGTIYPDVSRSRTVDMNGDGHDDILVFQTVNGVAGAVVVDFYRTATAQLIKPGLLTAVETEDGARRDIRYATSTAEMARDLNAGLQPRLLHFPVIVAKQVVRSTGTHGSVRSNVDVTEYFYHDPYYDAITREFRGFGTIGQLAYGDEWLPSATQPSAYVEETFATWDPDPVRRQLSGRQLSKKAYAVQTDPTLLGKLQASNSFDPTDPTLYSLSTATQTQPLVRTGQLLDETANAWSTVEQLTGSGAYFAWLSSSTTTEHSPSSSATKTTTRTFTRDAFNVATSEVEDTTWTGAPAGLTPPEYVKTTTRTYDQARATLQAFGVLSLPDQETTTVTLGSTGVAVATGSVTTEYDPSKALVATTHRTVYANAAPDSVLIRAAGSDATLLAALRSLAVSTRQELSTFGYDSIGNVVSRADALGLVEQTTYDAAGVLPLEHRKVNLEDRTLDQLSASTYRPDGRLSSRTSPLGLTSTYEYDDLGRKTARHDGDGGGETYNYGFAPEAAANLLLTTTQRSPSGGAPPGETETIERLAAYRVDGVPLAEVEDAEGGARIVAYQTYNRRGNRASSFSPYVVTRSAGSAGDLFALGQVPAPATADNADQVPMQFQFDPLGRLSARQFPGGRLNTIQHEPWGELTVETYATAQGSKSRQTYDVTTSLGLVAKMESGDGQQVTTLFGRDALGHLASIQLSGETSPRSFKYDSAGKQEYENIPGIGETYSLYDARERRAAEIHVAGDGVEVDVVELAYDSLDRVTERWESGRLAQTYAYDQHSAGYQPTGSLASEVVAPIGELTVSRVFDPNALYDYEEQLGYDARGAVVGRSVQIGQRTFVESFGRTLDGTLRTVVTPRGLREDFALNRANQVSGVTVSGSSFTAPESVIEQVGYTEKNQIGNIAYRLGAATTLAYDPHMLVLDGIRSTFQDGAGATQALQSLTYDVDGDERISAIHDAVQASVFGSVDRSATFAYDWRGELTQATRYQHLGVYAYDAKGAFTGNTDLPGTWLAATGSASSLVPAGTDASAFEYDGFGRLLKSPELDDAEYDAAGQLVYAQAAGGQKISYGYAPRGRRYYKHTVAADGTVSESLYPVTSYAEEPSAAQSFAFLGSRRLVRFDHGQQSASCQTSPAPPQCSDQWFYYLQDQTGSSDILIGADGRPVEQNLYLPYGSEASAADISPAWQAYLAANTTGLPAEKAHDRYGGQYLDDATGLYYTGTRYYHPGLGRFVAPDPSFVEEPRRCEDDTLGCALYGYARNTPLTVEEPRLLWQEFVPAGGREGTELATAAGYLDTWRSTGLVLRALAEAEIASHGALSPEPNKLGAVVTNRSTLDKSKTVPHRAGARLHVVAAAVRALQDPPTRVPSGAETNDLAMQDLNSR